MNKQQLKELTDVLTTFAPDQCTALAEYLESNTNESWDDLATDFAAAIRESFENPDECGP